jgi:cell division protein FtsW (lipid II flippase)
VTQRAETGLVVAASVIVGLGTALLSVGNGDLTVADVVITPLLFLTAFGGLNLAFRAWAPGGVRHLLPVVALLAAVGIIEVSRIDPDLGRLQRWWVLIGAATASGALWILRDRGVAVLRRFRYLFLVAAIGLLLLPMLPQLGPIGGATVNGSRLWVRVDLWGTVASFQPGEAAKLLIVAFLASDLSARGPVLSVVRRRIGSLWVPEPRQLVPVLLAFGVALVVLVSQRDLGASLLLFAVFATMLHAATGRASYLALGGLLAGLGGVAAYRFFDHVQVRVASWLHPFDDFAGTGYQVAQSLFALGAGGAAGTGLGQGRPDLIPAAATDYVFAAVAEEAGLAGSLAVLAGFGLLVAAGFGIAMRAGDPFRKLLATGLTLTLAIQTILILAGVMRLMPVTGITLPFMSYGGSSMMANLLLIALLIRVSHEEPS